jgi:hypothetical protein
MRYFSFVVRIVKAVDPDPLLSYKSDPDSYQDDEDPDPSFQNYANQCGSGSAA